MGKQATKGQPKKAAAKERVQNEAPDQAQNQTIQDDCTPDEMKASIQRTLAFLKYRAGANKNKSGQGWLRPRRCWRPWSLFLHALHGFFGSSGLSQDWRFGQTRIYPGLPEVWPQGPQVDGLLCQEGNQP